MNNQKSRGKERADEIDISPVALAAQIAQLTEDLDAARKERGEYLDGLQRERAEFMNYKRRVAEEREAMLGLAAEALLSKVLAVADDFDLALESRPAAIASDPWAEGIAAIDRKLRVLLESEGVRPIESIPGSDFNPRLHEAIVNVPNTGLPEGTIVAEARRGYRLRERILRPALVAVAAAPPDAPASDAGTPAGGEPIH